MDSLQVAIIGVGHPKTGLPVLASLAGYFGERPLEIRLYDPDPEFLEMYDRIARLLFKTADNPHHVFASGDLTEVLRDVDRVILELSDRSVAFFSKKRKEAGLQPAIDEILRSVPPEAKVLSLQEEPLEYRMGVYRLPEWVRGLPEPEPGTVPHQVHRYILGDEPFFELLRSQERSLLKDWLDNPLSAEFLSKSPAA